MAKVLILDGAERSALAATRSLGRHVEVVVAEAAPRCLAGRSRFAARTLRYPSPAAEPAAFEEWLLSECRRGNYDMLLPLTDLTTPLVLGRREELEAWTRLPFVDRATYDLASDKARLLELAKDLGLPVPATVSGAPRELIEAELPLKFPVVVKPRLSKTIVGRRVLAAGASYAANREELVRLLTGHPVLSRVPVLIQERIEGEGVGIFALYDSGRPVRLFSHRRLKEKPPSGGVSVVCESVAIDPLAGEYAIRLLDALGWHGVAMVEFRRGRDGVPYLLEINARFWGSLQLAIDAGMDFPHDLYRLARGESLSLAESRYQTGRRCRWLLGCLDHYYLRLKAGGGNDKGCPASNGTRPVGATGDFVFRWGDPLPFLWELRDYLGQLKGSGR